MYEKIKELAKKLNISIAAIEKKAGLSNGAIGKWETSTPTASNLKKVADVLGVPMEKLL